MVQASRLRLVCGAGVPPAEAAGTAAPQAAPQIGELIVTGPQVTRSYITRTQWNALSKIADGTAVWHRIGDSGYLDDQDRFWFCGRVAHRVLTADGPLYPVCCEAIFNQHPAIRRSAPGRRRPRRPATPCDYPRTAPRLHAKNRKAAGSPAHRNPPVRRVESPDRSNHRLPAASPFPGRYPSQRQDFP